MLALTKLILIITIITNLVLMSFIIKRKTSSVNKVLLLYISGIIGWAFTILINLWAQSLFVEKFIFSFAAFSATIQFFFAKIFPRPIKLFANVDYLIMIIGLFFIVISFVPGALFSSIRVSDQGYTDVGNGFLTAYFSLFMLICMLVPAIILFVKAKSKQQTNIIKQQLVFLGAGQLVFLTTALYTNLILPVFFGIYFFNGIGPAFSLILVGFILFIISKYRFLDIRLVIQRSLIYFFLLALTIGLYLSLVFIIGDFFEKTTRAAILLSAGLTAIAGIFGSRPIERFFSRMTDRFFFKDKYDYAKALRELSEILNINIDLAGLLRNVQEEIKKILKIRTIEFILIDQELSFDEKKLKLTHHKHPEPIIAGIKGIKEITIVQEIPFLIEDSSKKFDSGEIAFMFDLKNFCDKHRFSIVVPIILDKKTTAVIFLGEKLSGEQFTGEDLELLKTFSYQAAVALEKSRLYEAEKNYAAELELKVEHRTEKIKKLQEEQRQIMIDISHGLQTPLTVIKGEVEFLEEKLPDNKNVKSFEKSIDQISGFIYSMLNLAHMETTAEDFKKDKIHLSSLLDEMIEYFEVMSQEKGIKIIKDIDPGIVILGKKDKLEEMLNNLVSNSVKYIDNEKKIFISLKKKDDQAELTIEDTGIGIKKEFLKKIFNRFYRVMDGKHAGIPGTGIGLAVVKKIVEKHGGSIRAESEVGKWTRMIVDFNTV